jgi:hypothetical protein
MDADRSPPTGVITPCRITGVTLHSSTLDAVAEGERRPVSDAVIPSLPTGRSCYQTSAFLNTSEFPTELPTHTTGPLSLPMLFTTAFFSHTTLLISPSSKSVRQNALHSTPPFCRCPCDLHVSYIGTSLIRNSASLGPCCRKMPRAPWWS